jgi:hypothetical protein
LCGGYGCHILILAKPEAAAREVSPWHDSMRPETTP